MANVTSVHVHLRNYERHLARLEELRGLLHDQLATAVSQARPAAGSAHRAVARGRVAAIEAALERMNRGRYGICGRCGALIPFEQLRRRPERSACDGCAGARHQGAPA
ncbi:hypothetical protein Ssi03_37250 [Sphaerisporangium siamense]|uniref:DnaK suppressor protein n=1 Tax=Sphaerisporangium siamense TaxID=795645 RepID=A0A7W7D7D5_9ACTN|nr:hypothetical protein [Sphaerisporangium siamense]MBB4701610.1 DnaK suppressor protein [Sphaerisporangium siamense]GII85735.1 hypothetical protein Ssi03_37250 [Sphaerisporangium siamense]